MTINELIEYVNSHVTSDIVEDFNNIFLFDHNFDRSDNVNRCRMDYYSFLGLYKRYHGEPSNIFISELKEKGYLSVDSSETKIFEIRLALTNLKRSILLQKCNISNNSSFEEKLNFSLEFPEYFRIFREYEIPNFGQFSIFPENSKDISLLIRQFDSLMSNYRVSTKRFSREIAINCSQNSFLVNVNKFTYIEEVDDHLTQIEKIYESDKTPPFVKICYLIHKALLDYKFDLIEFLNETKNPILTFLTLRYKSNVTDVLNYKIFLLNFVWEATEEKILTLQTENIKLLSTTDYRTYFMDAFYDKDVLIISYTNKNMLNFLNKMMFNKIFKYDMLIINSIVQDVISELNTLNYLNLTLIENVIANINASLNKLINPGLIEPFIIHFLNAFSKHEILILNQEVWHKFKLLWIDNVKLNLKTKKLKGVNSSLSFTYLNLVSGSENLTKLMNFLKMKGFIDKETSIADFKAVFSNSIINNKIIWETNISDLAYFVKCLHNTNKKVKDTKQKQWNITINCFVIPKDKEPLTNSRLRQQKIPATSTLLETAVNLL